MIRRLRLPLALAVAAWCLATVVAVAAVTTVAGTVQAVDAAAGRLTLRAAAGTLVAVQAPAALLASLQIGDTVEVKQAGPHATIVRTLARAPRSARDGARSRP